MFKLTNFISFILLLICSIKANKTTELLEKLINQQKEFDCKLNNAIKVQEIYERRIEEIMKQISGFSEKLYDINSRTYYSKEIRSERSNKRVDEIGNEVKHLEQNINESMTADSHCGDWEPYKEDKCFKIFDKVRTQSYEDAEKTCHQQENGSSLITIRFLEEQEFISNLFKTHKVANDIWIGVKYTNKKYKWNDDSDLVFTNWEQGSPKNKTDHCVQLRSDENSFGKWSDALCNRKNLVVCQKMQTWSPSHLQKILLNTIKNPIPIGFIYVQLPNEKSPTEIWPWMTWKDITSAYAGLFFRAEGGGAAAFGEVQAENSPRLTAVITYFNYEVGASPSGIRTALNAGETSKHIFTGSHTTHNDRSMAFEVSNGEVRPRNMAIRVWKRTR